MHKRIVLTGGGTAGHVTPNLALIPYLQADDWTVDYIGSHSGVEKDLVSAVGVPYHSIRSGKLRRYFSWQNFVDPLNILIGIGQSIWLLRRLKADVVFSKGGFVALPIVIGAYVNRIPVVIHESDMTPGLANRLSFPFAKLICLTFENAKKHLKSSAKIQVTGTPIRATLFTGDRSKGIEKCGFSGQKNGLLVMGGSQGSGVINQCVRQALPELTKQYHVIHLCGKGKVEQSLLQTEDYHQLEYAHDELPDLLAASDTVLSRAGANSLCELLALKKPHILVPLSKQVSRGDQIQNAAYFKKQGISEVIQEEDFNPSTLLTSLKLLQESRDARIQKMQQLNLASATKTLLQLLNGMLPKAKR